MATRIWSATKIVSQGGASARARKVAVASLLALGSMALLHAVSGVCRRGGLDLEKAARHGLDRGRPKAPSLGGNQAEMRSPSPQPIASAS